MNNRGVLPFVVAYWIVGGAIAVYGLVQVKHILAPSKPVAAVTTLDTTAQASQQAARTAQAAADAKIKADTDERAARDRKDQETAAFVAGVGISLQAEVDPSVNVKIAKQLNEEAARTLPPVQAAVFKQMQDMIVGLAQANHDLKGKALVLTDAYNQKAVEAEQAAKEAKAVQVVADQKTAELKEESKKSVSLSQQTATLSASLKTWAETGDNLWTRIKALATLVVILAAVGGFIYWRLRGTTGVVQDLVAEKTHVESLIAAHAPEAEAKIKAGVDAWWNKAEDKSSHATLAAVDAIKAKLRI